MPRHAHENDPDCSELLISHLQFALKHATTLTVDRNNFKRRWQRQAETIRQLQDDNNHLRDEIIRLQTTIKAEAEAEELEADWLDELNDPLAAESLEKDLDDFIKWMSRPDNKEDTPAPRVFVGTPVEPVGQRGDTAVRPGTDDPDYSALRELRSKAGY